jgi:hypothetical protein
MSHNSVRKEVRGPGRESSAGTWTPARRFLVWLWTPSFVCILPKKQKAGKTNILHIPRKVYADFFGLPRRIFSPLKA